jgi:protein-tyrosine-phosphatase
MNILFVCTANISRSFLAQNLLEHELRSHEVHDIAVSSAGTNAKPGAPADPKIVDHLLEKGIRTEEHKSRRITKEDVDWADRILVMERWHKDNLEGMWPEAREKIDFLGRFASGGLIDDDIIDPFGKSPYHYRVAEAQISLAIEALVKKLMAN